MKYHFALAAIAMFAGVALARAGEKFPSPPASARSAVLPDSTPHPVNSTANDDSAGKASAQSKYAQDSASAISARARDHFAARRYALAAGEFRASIGFVDDVDTRLWLYFAEWNSAGNPIAAEHLKKYINDAQAAHALSSVFMESLFEAILGDGSPDTVFQNAKQVEARYQPLLIFKANFYLGLNNLMSGARITARTYWMKCINSGLSQFIEYDYALAHMPK